MLKLLQLQDEEEKSIRRRRQRLERDAEESQKENVKKVEEKETQKRCGKEAELDDPNSGLDDQNSGLNNQNSGVVNQNSGVVNQNSGVVNQNSGVHNQNSGLEKQDSELDQLRELELYEKRRRNRSKLVLPEWPCFVRYYLRQYCTVLAYFAVFSLFYSDFFCNGDDNFLGFSGALENPRFNKYDTRVTCPNVQKSGETVVIAILHIFVLLNFNKLHIGLLFLALLVYFGFETRKIKLEFGEKRMYSSDFELSTRFVELRMLVLHQILLFPLFSGEYFILRHVYQKPARQMHFTWQDMRKKEKDKLERLVEEEQTYANEVFAEIEAKEAAKQAEEDDEEEQYQDYLATAARVNRMNDVFQEKKEKSDQRKRAKVAANIEWAQKRRQAVKEKQY